MPAPDARPMVARRIAAALLGACVAMAAMAVASLWIPGGDPRAPSPLEVIAFLTIFLTFPSVGFVVVWKRPGNPVGWLFIVIGVVLTASVTSGVYVSYAVYGGTDLPGADTVAWLGGWGWTVAASIALPLAVMLFPDGRLPGPRWRLPAAIGTVAAVVAMLGIAITPGPLPDFEGRIVNPYGVGGPVGDAATIVGSLGTIPLAYMMALGLAALVTRFRRADAQRQQVKWLLYPMSILVVAIVFAAVTGNDTPWVAVLVALAALPVCAGIAILRYRLYDIDVVIRRTLVYGAVVAVLGVLYVAFVLSLQLALSGLTGSDTLPVALSTLAIAALFGPVRSRVRAVVDRRFFRSRYDAQQTIESFAGALRDRVELEQVGGTLVEFAARAVHPTSAAMWLRRGQTQ